jgi:predicted amidohydrolase YtcJ
VLETAALNEADLAEYCRKRGALKCPPEEIEALVRTLHPDGWPIGIHADGDAAIDVVLDAYERGNRRRGWPQTPPPH